MFNDKSWLRLVKKSIPTATAHLGIDRLAIHLAAGRTDLLYVVLLAAFFFSLRDDYEYDGKRQEIKFKPGFPVNVMSATDEPQLPMQELLPDRKDSRLEYLFLNEASSVIRTLTQHPQH